MVRESLVTCMVGVLTAGLIALPCTARAATTPDRTPLPFTADVSIAPTWHTPLSAGWDGKLEQPKRAPLFMAPIGAFAAGTALPTVLFVQDAMESYEPYRLASGIHPAELQPKFHGTALVYSAISVGLAPAGAALFYTLGGGNFFRALGGGLFGMLFAVIGIPVGGLLALTLTSPFQDNPNADPQTVYTTYALSLYGMTTSMSLVGFFLVGKKKQAQSTAALGLEPILVGSKVALQPTMRVRF